MPPGSVAVVIVNAGAIFRDKLLVSLWGEAAESVTVTATVTVPVWAVVPLITPVVAFIVRPVGKPVADQW
jgi:hypothetical protein